MRHRSFLRHPATIAVAASAALVGLTAISAGSAERPTAGVPSPDPDGINGFKAIGYFPAWAPSSSGYEVADLVRTGAVGDLTHLNYAFGNVTTDLVCDITDAVGPEGPEGDPEADYTRLVPASASVDGVADTAAQPLAGNFNQLRELKQRYPDLKVLISLGGWTWSDNFSDAAATPESRARLVESCLDTYIRGDLPVRGAQGGEGVAAGVFDGIDIDWEWPAADGEHPSPRPAEDRENFLALMELFRAELDALGAETGEDYLLSGFAPAGWAPRTNGGWVDPRLAAVVDYLNVQGYDYHGTWVANRTGHQGNLHKYEWPDAPGQWANWGLAADDLMAAYRAAGYRDEQLNLGLAAYGQGWRGVDDPTPGSPAEGAIGTAPYAELKDVGEVYYDETAVAGYRWDGDQWWSLDTPQSVTAKAEWIAVNGYGGAFWWDITGDFQNELGSALGSTLRVATPGPLVAGPGAAPWYPSGVYKRGDVVAHNGLEYVATRRTLDQEPGVSGQRAWRVIGPRGTAPAEPEECAPAWSEGSVYRRGDVVSRAGVNHTALRHTRGELPGSTPRGAWDAGLPCV